MTRRSHGRLSERWKTSPGPLLPRKKSTPSAMGRLGSPLTQVPEGIPCRLGRFRLTTPLQPLTTADLKLPPILRCPQSHPFGLVPPVRMMFKFLRSLLFHPPTVLQPPASQTRTLSGRIRLFQSTKNPVSVRKAPG